MKLKHLLLGLQFFFVVFTGIKATSTISKIDVHTLLFGAGVGTLIFYFVTKRRVPLFLGPSYALLALIESKAASTEKELMAAAILIGLIYIIVSLWIRRIGLYKIIRLFPPIITANIIVIIGLSLAQIGARFIGNNWNTALVTMAFIILFYFFVPRLRDFSILLGIAAGWAFSALLLGQVHSAEHTASVLTHHFPAIVMPKFTLKLVIAAVICVFATILEHIGDILAISDVAGKAFYFEPGLDKTLIGNGLSNIVSGFLGMWGLTTYTQGTGTYVLLRDYNPVYVLIAGITTLAVSFFAPLCSYLSAIPREVLGAVMIYMFGFVATIGLRIFIANRVDMKKPRNLFITASMLGIGIGGRVITVVFAFPIGAVGFAGIVGVILNLILPKDSEGSA